MTYLVLLAAGLLVGLLVGRWWALALPAALGVWIGLTEELELGGALVGAVYGGTTGCGVAVGVGLRKYARHPPTPPAPPD